MPGKSRKNDNRKKTPPDDSTTSEPARGSMGPMPRRAPFNNLILHIHPRLVPRAALDLSRTFGLGGLSLALFTILALTGFLLLFVYEPLPDKAYQSILTLRDEILFGRLVRNVHHWAGNLLFVTTFLHMARVIFTGAFQDRRRVNWFIGTGLLALVLFSNFTGYLLPWDQLAYWAVTICIGMVEYVPLLGPGLRQLLRAGPDVGTETLLNFYTFHIMMLPIGFCLLLPFHFWLVRKAGGIAVPKSALKKEPADYVPVIPNLVTRELTAAQILVAGLLVFSILHDAPLDAMANPGMSPNPAKAPWYFAGLQELIIHFHPLFAVFVIPLLGVLALLSLPYVMDDVENEGTWFYSPKGRKTALLAALSACLVVPVLIISDEAYRHAGGTTKAPSVMINGIVPFLGILAVLTLMHFFARKWIKASRTESLQSLLLFCLVALGVCTVTGIWFRGEGMALAWPWG